MKWDKENKVNYTIDTDDRTCDIGYDAVEDVTWITTNIQDIRKSLKTYCERHPEKVLSAKRTTYNKKVENWDVKLKGWDFWRHN